MLSFIRERGLAVPDIAPRAVLLFVQSVFVAVICRPGEATAPAFLHFTLLDQHLLSWSRVPQFTLLAFAGAFAVLLVRFLLYRKPVESGLLWALLATLLGLHAGGVGWIATAYLGTAGLILVSSIIENSYVLAYHDELTALPARRAFNDALFRLEPPYAIAVVDIDHFKNFNDTYGHDTGDQVLRLVADRLARVTGGGHAYRVGGEEFSILFPGKSMTEAVDHLETLRTAIADTVFRVRGGQERRRTTPRGPDRRTAPRRKSPRSRHAAMQSGELSVTVSIGVAEPTARTHAVEQVIQAADKALYRAKQSGRNRTETASTPRASRSKRSIA
jgi:diguanylate cyclase (GGDEF)-like protein